MYETHVSTKVKQVYRIGFTPDQKGNVVDHYPGVRVIDARHRYLNNSHGASKTEITIFAAVVPICGSFASINMRGC